jgi:hypothetical protein
MEVVSMPTYIVIESGSDRVLGVTHAADPVSACIEVSRRSGSPTSRVLYEIRSHPRYGDWLAYELPARFDDPIAWEIFGLDAVRHGRLVTVIARRMAR